jgi:hypothetical protein
MQLLRLLADDVRTKVAVGPAFISVVCKSLW